MKKRVTEHRTMRIDSEVATRVDKNIESLGKNGIETNFSLYVEDALKLQNKRIERSTSKKNK